MKACGTVHCDGCRRCSPQQLHAVESTSASASASALAYAVCDPVGRARTSTSDTGFQGWYSPSAVPASSLPRYLTLALFASPSPRQPTTSQRPSPRGAFLSSSDFASGSNSAPQNKHARVLHAQHWCGRRMSDKTRRRNCRRCCLIRMGSTLVPITAEHGLGNRSSVDGRVRFRSAEDDQPVPNPRHIREPR